MPKSRCIGLRGKQDPAKHSTNTREGNSGDQQTGHATGGLTPGPTTSRASFPFSARHLLRSPVCATPGLSPAACTSSCGVRSGRKSPDKEGFTALLPYAPQASAAHRSMLDPFFLFLFLSETCFVFPSHASVRHCTFLWLMIFKAATAIAFWWVLSHM